MIGLKYNLNYAFKIVKVIGDYKNNLNKMKKTIFLTILCSLLLFSASFAQQVNKPGEQWKPDPNRVYTITLTGTFIDFTRLSVGLNKVKTEIDSTDFKASDRNLAKAQIDRMLNSMDTQYKLQIDADRAKFVADSLKAIKPATTPANRNKKQ